MKSETTEKKRVNIGLVGFGTVGSGVWKNLEKNSDLLQSRLGVEMKIHSVAVRDLKKARSYDLASANLGEDWKAIVENPEIDIVVELMGGTDDALELVESALCEGKKVVTGNKALLAEYGPRLFQLLGEQQDNAAGLYFEAAVAGGIPIIKALGESLIANRIVSIHGIINGTCNYILSAMTEKNWSYDQALSSAMELGFAEADPTLDVNGWDAAHKAIVLAWLSYGLWVDPAKIHVKGIENVQLEDIEFARQLGYRLKLVSVIQQAQDEKIELRTEPVLLPQHHMLAHVRGVNNALAVEGDVVGEALFYGSGAGQDATSSAVLADLAEAAQQCARDFDTLSQMGQERGIRAGSRAGEVLPLEQILSRYYLRLSVTDQPGVVEKVSGLLAAQEIGIASMIQPTAPNKTEVPLVFLLHEAPFTKMKQALAEIESLDVLQEKPVFYRIEELSAPLT